MLKRFSKPVFKPDKLIYNQIISKDWRLSNYFFSTASSSESIPTRPSQLIRSKALGTRSSTTFRDETARSSSSWPSSSTTISCESSSRSRQTRSARGFSRKQKKSSASRLKWPALLSNRSRNWSLTRQLLRDTGQRSRSSLIITRRSRKRSSSTTRTPATRWNTFTSAWSTSEPLFQELSTKLKTR